MELNQNEMIEKKATKFEKNLTQSTDGIKAARAAILGSNAKIAQETLVNKLKGEENTLNIRLQQLTDLSPNETTSLQVGGGNFNADAWVKEMQDIKVSLLNKKVELSLAQDTLSEWF